MIFDLPWQELVFTAGGFVFFIALLPSIYSQHKPALLTSLTTAVFLSLFVVAFATLGLWLSAAAQALGASAWWILAVQGWRRNRK